MHVPQQRRKQRSCLRRILSILLLVLLMPLLWAGSITLEWRLGRRALPWSPYKQCAVKAPEVRPETVRVGFYEEFPAPWRLEPLRLVDFPVSLAVAASSRAEFLDIKQYVRYHFPQVREIYFWPVLERKEGYYPGSWSDGAAVRRAAEEAQGLPVLWDLELPPHWRLLSPRDFPGNRAFLQRWFAERDAPVHLWRTHAPLGLNPLPLDLLGLHFDPDKYEQLWLHLELYSTGGGLPEGILRGVLRCGVQRYGDRFIPSFGMLNDGEGPDRLFLPHKTLERNLRIAREVGVSEIWIFGVNGLDQSYLDVLRNALPLEGHAPVGN